MNTVLLLLLALGGILFTAHSMAKGKATLSKDWHHFLLYVGIILTFGPMEWMRSSAMFPWLFGAGLASTAGYCVGTAVQIARRRLAPPPTPPLVGPSTEERFERANEIEGRARALGVAKRLRWITVPLVATAGLAIWRGLSLANPTILISGVVIGGMAVVQWGLTRRLEAAGESLRLEAETLLTGPPELAPPPEDD